MPAARTLCALLPAFLALSAATVPDDLAQLNNSCQAVAGILNASLNNSTAVNTSSLIQGIGWEIGACLANLNSATDNMTASSASTQPSAAPSPTTSTYDAPYFVYADSMLDLTEALIRRGQVPHAEPNQPVYIALQSLYNVIQSYGFQLDNTGKISRSALIRTLTVGNSIVDAESVWARNLSAAVISADSDNQRKRARRTAAYVA